MRLWILPVAALVGFAVGCGKTSQEGGTPNTKDSFTLTVPSSAVTTAKPIKQDTSETYEGSINRGSDFKKDVKLQVEAPKELDVKLTKQEIKASDGDTRFNITVKAAKDAPVADHTIKITATPADGGKATAEQFKVTVKAP